MWTLGLETSTRSGSVAVSDGADVLRARSLGGQAQKHAAVLFQELDTLLSDVGITPRQIGRIGVSVGPGSFTGLRIGVVAAKTLAWALGCELKAIDSFLAVAQAAPETVPELIVVGDAQRGDLFVGRYWRDERGVWLRKGDIELVPADRFLSFLSGVETVSGPGATRYLPQLQDRARVLDESFRAPMAQAVCRLAEREDISLSDCWTLKPVYLRKSSAEEKWEKSHPSQS